MSHEIVRSALLNVKQIIADEKEKKEQAILHEDMAALFDSSSDFNVAEALKTLSAASQEYMQQQRQIANKLSQEELPQSPVGIPPQQK
ncbi:MAG TPA: hypothetical protein VLG12_07520 [Candidatus Saccharimonadales bacterium]|nr:hypothetical protein [Candidatus Saccharimonadales bacterium]